MAVMVPDSLRSIYDLKGHCARTSRRYARLQRIRGRSNAYRTFCRNRPIWGIYRLGRVPGRVPGIFSIAAFHSCRLAGIYRFMHLTRTFHHMDE